MPRGSADLAIEYALNLRPGELVEVRSASEILSTLDADGAMDALPFMPEMLQYCGKRLRVYKRADKTCDTIRTSNTWSRRMFNAVHLATARCDGSSHGGCQAQCLIFWKEAWLKRVEDDAAREEPTATVRPGRSLPVVDVKQLEAATRRPSDPATGKPAYTCQATELNRATHDLAWWDARQYFRELFSGNVSFSIFVQTLGRATLNAVQRLRDGRQFPTVEPRCKDKTPTASLDLQPGELVRIRSKEEIFATLNQQGRNRGLWFDVEMLPFCGRVARVKQRVDHIINEKNGEMMHFSNPCIMLEEVACGGCLSRERLFCPRAIYSYWREIWLERVVPSEIGTPECEELTAAGSV